jgi:dephospho-CoA kinase
MKTIGLSGAYCAGKNYVASLLEKEGIPGLDLDKLGHTALEMQKEALVQRFGREVLAADGSVDRRALGRRVFSRPGDLQALESMVHPCVNRLSEQWIAAQKTAGKAACVINAALLHKSSAFPGLDAIIIVQAPLVLRLLRARRRDHLSWREIGMRFFSQRSFASQYLGKKADIFSVTNYGTSWSNKRLLKTLRMLLDRIMGR